MIGLLFTLLVVLGFAFHFLATLPVNFPAARIGWGCWLVASVIWALSSGVR